MPIIQTGELTQSSPLSADESHQTYCGLDSALTLEILHEILAIADPEALRIYSFERALQGPYLDMMRRGLLVDAASRNRACAALYTKRDLIQGHLDTLARAIWDGGKDRKKKPEGGLNSASPTQLQAFFYGSLRLPEVWISQKGVRKISCNREALEKLFDHYLYARPFVNCILALRDISKQLDVFESEVDPDGRWRAAYNIAGTETGRPSSSTNAYGTGGNAQNISPGLRHVFVSDPGWKYCAIDLEQVEARDVGYLCGVLFGDWSFLDACEGGDLHTNNARLVWPERPWTGDRSSDRALADEIFYREFSYRDMAKRGGHLSNYMGTAWMMSRALKIPMQLAEDFQNRYVRGPSAAYPCIPRYWQWVGEQIQTTQQILTPFGRRRHFMGRPGEDATLREGIAFVPQSMTADRMNLGLWRVWDELGDRVQVLAQGFDSILFQFQEGDEAVIPLALDLVRVELRSPCGRSYVVPAEAKVGWNWGPASAGNPDGLVKWSEAKPDKRARRTGMLERRVG